MSVGVFSTSIPNGSNTSCELQIDEEDLATGRIPELLGLDFAVWLVLIIVFLVIRYLLPDYSRAGLATSSQYMVSLSSQSKLIGEGNERSLSLSTMLYEDKRWYTWFINFFYKLSYSDIRNRCGPDAVLYLSLHRHLIFLLCVFSVISIAIILPINYTKGNLASDGFPQTTISNLDPSSGYLWFHTFFSLAYLGITAIFMFHFSLLLGKQQLEYSNHSVMVQWIPPMVHREDILQHLQEALPDSTVTDLQFAYDISHLFSLDNKLSSVSEKLDEVDSIRNELGTRETVLIGWKKLFCCVKSYHIDAKNYYEKLHSDLRKSIVEEKDKVKEQKRLGIGFITFGLENDAKSFCSSYKLFHVKPKSNVYEEVKADLWWVSPAPFHLDIIWENLSMPYLIWWIRWLLINIVLVVLVFFFTTPSIVLSSIDDVRFIFTNITHVPDITETNPFIKNFLPALLLIFFASVMPLLVSYSSYLESHWTKSFREQTIMRKTYFFLLIMVIVVPSIGLASLNTLAETAKKDTFGNVLRDRLRCAFLPNNGAFFVGYVITAAFIRMSFKLLRLPELILYAFYRLRAKTRLQKELALKKAADFDFNYGIEYAWNLVLFNMVVSFSLTTPIIVPFGVLYFIMAYYTSKYNIYYVYKASPFNGRQFLHRSAVNFVIVGVVFLQLQTLFFSILRLGGVDPRSVIMILAFIFTVICCTGVMFFGCFKHLLPLQLRIRLDKEYNLLGSFQDDVTTSLSASEEADEIIAKGSYIPPVLRETPQVNSASFKNSGYQSFGSTDQMGRRTNALTSDSHSISATQQQTVSTLERSISKSKPIPGGAGANAGKKSLGIASPSNDHDTAKSFV